MNVRYENKIKKDIERLERRGKEIQNFFDVIDLIVADKLLPRHKDHPLVGNWRGWRDCHVEPDWILIYKIVGEELYLGRTGTHADLF